MGVKDYDLNPDNNTQINGINIAEGCPPSGINNAMRQLMADVKEDSDAQNTAIEALETKAETPASAEELGPVKVGDGLSMGEDGTLSADLATADAPGMVKASTTAQAGAVPVANGKGKLDVSWLPPFNSRLVITESNAAWTPPVTGWARVTAIGGGGAGGCGGNSSEESGGGGGGGGAGNIMSDYIYLDIENSHRVVIGAGGRPSTGVDPSSTTYGKTGGAGGETAFDDLTAAGGTGGAGGGANGRGGGTGGSPGGSSGSRSEGGCGGFNGTPYGGGGGGCGGQSVTYSERGTPGKGSANGSTGSVYVSASQNPGGEGGYGAVIIEYYDPAKETS